MSRARAYALEYAVYAGLDNPRSAHISRNNRVTFYDRKKQGPLKLPFGYPYRTAKNKGQAQAWAKRWVDDGILPTVYYQTGGTAMHNWRIPAKAEIDSKVER